MPSGGIQGPVYISFGCFFLNIVQPANTMDPAKKILFTAI